MALGLGVLPMMLDWPLILFLADSPLFVVQVPQFTPPGVVQSWLSSVVVQVHQNLQLWFKSTAPYSFVQVHTSIQVLGHIYMWFKSMIILSLGLSPRLLQISVQVLDPQSLIQFKSLTLSVLDELQAYGLVRFKFGKSCGNVGNFIGSSYSI
ncbi:hypothetical protein R3W88_024336 [Solanum pinnatisectum]|uniref:Uncharacterized protein n=1 Tax=Solanum pinnatisectum TaxID=50273 RepID=A0AAV9LZZ1_9SOLN|nr:hypothetical protein R3W88_024336 [Solanum pinnatisectum]